MISSEMLRLGTSRSVIRELFEYGNQRAAVVGREHVFDFSLGNPSVPAPPEVAALLAKLVCEDPVSLHGYTSAPGAPEVRAAVAEDLNRRFAAGVSADHLYMTAGAAAALSACFKALALPGDEFVAIAPFFPEYRCFVEQGAGAKLVVCPAAQDFQIDLSALEGCLNEHTKAVIVNSPNNPSGAVYTRETLTALAGLLRDASARYGHPIYLISDEPYREIVYGVEVPWLPALYSNTLVCYSWSKSLSLPGQRIGYALVPPCVEDWQQVYAAVCGAGRALGYVNAPALFQRVVAQLPGNTADLSVYRENRDTLYTALVEAGYECPRPDGAFYLFPAVPGGDADAFSRRAMEKDLLVVPGDGFGCPGHVRISYCVQPEMLRRSLELFRRLARSE